MAPVVVVTLHVLMWTGVAFILAFLLLGRTRSYLLYFGVGALGMALGIVVPAGIRWLVVVLTVAAFAAALWDGLRDSKERLREFRQAQREREEAFAELQMAVLSKETGRTQPDAGEPQD